MGKLTYSQLNHRHIKQMHDAFTKAFSDYPLPFSFARAAFEEKFIERLSISFSLSAGAFYDEKLVGFIFHSLGNLNDKLTMYNGGTGVIPEFRGNGIISRLYEYLNLEIQAAGVQQIVLEVLTKNEKAIRTYNHIGFEKSDLLKSYRMPASDKTLKTPPENLRLITVKNTTLTSIAQSGEQSPSFLDCISQLEKILVKLNLVIAELDNETVGYIIYQQNGRISNMAVADKFRNLGIGGALINFVKNQLPNQALTVMNVRSEAKNVHQFLLSLGFENQLDQYELILPIQGS